MKVILRFISEHKVFLLAIFFSLLFSTGIVIFAVNKFSREGILLNMSVVPEYDTTLIFTGLEVKDGEDWTKGKKIRSEKLAGGKRNQIRLLFPLQELLFLHMQLFSGGGKIQIHSMELAGKKNHDLLQVQTFPAKTLRRHDAEKGKKILSTSAVDSAVIFFTKDIVRKSKHTDPILTFLIFLLLFFISCPLFHFFLQKLFIPGAFNSKAVLIILFCCLLPLPVSKINQDTVSKQENRSLAPLPELINKNGIFNVKFGTQFEEFLKDHFRGRARLLLFARKLDSLINRFCWGRAFNENIAAGDNGFFFLRKENSIRNYQNLDPLSHEAKHQYLQNLCRFAAWCNKHGAKFYYFIAPDKNRIYGEHLSFLPKIYPDSQSRAALWVKYIRENSNINVLYPVEELKKRKKEGFLYYKADTHWNHLGAYHGYRLIAERIKKDLPDLPLFHAEKFTEEQIDKYDMYFLAPEFIKDDMTRYKKPEIASYFELASDKLFHNPAGKYSAVIVRDSFSNLFMRYFYYSFRETLGNWGALLTKKNYEAVKEGKVNVVVLEHVERSLSNTMGFLEMFIQNKEGEM